MALALRSISEHPSTLWSSIFTMVVIGLWNRTKIEIKQKEAGVGQFSLEIGTSDNIFESFIFRCGDVTAVSQTGETHLKCNNAVPRTEGLIRKSHFSEMVLKIQAYSRNNSSYTEWFNISIVRCSFGTQTFSQIIPNN